MKNSIFRQVLTETCEDNLSIQRGNKLIDQGNPERGNKILDKGNPDIPLNEESEQVYVVKFWVRQHDDSVDYDWDVRANSPEEAVEKVQSGIVKGPYGQDLPRLARNFSAKLKS